MWRRLLLASSILVVLVFGAGALLYAFRTDVVESLAKRELARRGLPQARLTVAEAGLGRLRIADLTAGPEGELALTELQALYRPLALLDGRVDELRLSGLSLRVDATGEGPVFGGLQEPLDRLLAADAAEADEDAGRETALPAVLLEDGRIELLTPAGPATVAVEGRAEPRPEGGLALQANLALAGEAGNLLAKLRAETDAAGGVSGGLRIDAGHLDLGADRLSARVLPGGLEFRRAAEGHIEMSGEVDLEALVLRGAELGSLRMAIELDDTALTLESSLRGPGDDHRAELLLALDDLAGRPGGEFRFDGRIEAASPLWRLVPGPVPSRGGADLALRTSGRLPGPVPRAAESLPAWALDGRYQGELDLSVREVALPNLAERLDAVVRADLAVAERAAKITLREDARITADGPLSRLLLGRAEPGGGRGKGLTVELAAAGPRPFVLGLQPDPEGFKADLEGRIVARLAGRGQVAASTRLAARSGADWRRARVEVEPTRVTATGGGLAGLPVSALDLSGTLSGFWSGPLGGEASKPGDGGPLEHDFRLAKTALRFDLERKGEKPLAVGATLGPLRFTARVPGGAPYRGRIELDGGRLALPDLLLSLEGLSAGAALPLGAERPAITVAVQTLRHLAETPLFNPLGLEAVAEREGGRFALTGRVSGPPGLEALSIAGSYDPEAARAELRAAMPPLEFTAGGAQPAAWSPRLAALRDVTGRIEGFALLVSGPGGIESEGAVGLDGLSFEAEGMRIEDLDLDLRLSELLPPASPPAQPLTIARIEAAVPVEEISARLRIEPADPPRVLVEQAEFSALSGRYRLRDARIDPGRERQDLTVEVIGLDLGALFARLDVEGLGATGTLDGQVPLVAGPAGIAIADARLEARAPGVLRYSSRTAAQALAGGGETTALMLRALENFQYETLGLTAAMNTDREVEVRLSILGKNPDVLEGHPFRFNINLTGDLSPIFDAIAKGYEISDDLLKRSWRLGP